MSKIKKEKLINSLKKVGLYDSVEIKDEDDGTFTFILEHGLGNELSIILMPINDTIFNCIYYDLGNLDYIEKIEEVLKLFNTFNNESLMMKFTIDEHNNLLMAKITYIADDEEFNGDNYLMLVSEGSKLLRNNYYNKMMKVMW